MLLNYTPYFSVLFVTAVISAVVALTTLRRHSRSPGRTPFIWMMSAITMYAMVAALEAAAVRLPDKLFWSVLEYVGSGSAITFFLLFILHFTQRQHWLSPSFVALLWLIPTLNILLVATNSWHRLVWTGFGPGPPNSNLIVYHHGPGFYWIMACVYTYAVIAVLLLAKASFHPSLVYRQQAQLALLGAIFPLLGGIAYILDIVPPGINLPPMCFMFTGLLYIANLSRFRLFDLVPVARDRLIETMLDGVIVLDLRNRIIDVNPSAKQLFQLDNTSIGQPVSQSFYAWQALTEMLHSNADNQAIIPFNSNPQTYIEIQLIPLRDRRGQPTGKLVLARDVTDRHQLEIELRHANSQLTTQLNEIKQLQAQLRDQAARDGLTGLFNRSYFDEMLPRELALAKRQSYSLTLILIDLDYFKQINDTYGHLAGDAVLRVFADLLHRRSRASDITCRYGGEEFVLAMPDMNSKQAFERTDQIRQTFETICIEVEDHKICSTFSAGVAVFPTNGTSLTELMQAADQALYRAKSTGRNCIQLA